MIRLHQAEIGYGRVLPFPPLSGHFSNGSLTAVVGVNGAGKSTLLKTLAGLQPLQGGSLHFSGNQPPQMAYLPQHAELDRQFPISVSDLVAMGNWGNSGMFSRLNKRGSQHIIEALDCVGMTKMARSPVGELSCGQLQRALFARLLVKQAPMILLDEPFTGIDSATTKLLIQVIEKLHQEGRTLIAVMHDLSIVSNHFPRVLILKPHCYHWGDANRVLEHIPMLSIFKKSHS